jgi:hypothetical protein
MKSLTRRTKVWKEVTIFIFVLVRFNLLRFGCVDVEKKKRRANRPRVARPAEAPPPLLAPAFCWRAACWHRAGGLGTCRLGRGLQYVGQRCCEYIEREAPAGGWSNFRMSHEKKRWEMRHRRYPLLFSLVQVQISTCAVFYWAGRREARCPSERPEEQNQAQKAEQRNSTPTHAHQQLIF